MLIEMFEYIQSSQSDKKIYYIILCESSTIFDVRQCVRADAAANDRRYLQFNYKLASNQKQFWHVSERFSTKFDKIMNILRKVVCRRILSHRIG